MFSLNIYYGKKTSVLQRTQKSKLMFQAACGCVVFLKQPQLIVKQNILVAHICIVSLDVFHSRSLCGQPEKIPN